MVIIIRASVIILVNHCFFNFFELINFQQRQISDQSLKGLNVHLDSITYGLQPAFQIRVQIELGSTKQQSHLQNKQVLVKLKFLVACNFKVIIQENSLNLLPKDKTVLLIFLQLIEMDIVKVNFLGIVVRIPIPET